MRNIKSSKLNAFSHRLSTILKADYIYVVMDGEIVEEGSHSSLILENGKYKELWSKQIYSKEPINRPKSHSSSHTPPYTNTIKTSSVSKLNKKAQGKYSKSNTGSILYENVECNLDKSENDSTRQVSVCLIVKIMITSITPRSIKLNQALKKIIELFL